jgi:FkbM family methyltransferase
LRRPIPDIVPIRCGPVEVQLIARGDRICEKLSRGEEFEPASLEMWAKICAVGGRVLDVGAYTGLYSIAAALIGCKATAFEPMVYNLMRFRANAKLNDVAERAKVNLEAISDKVGFSELSINPTVRGLTTGASLLHYSGGDGPQEIRLSVPTRTVDSLALKELTAMKIDVERAEPMVLRGAQETIERLRPAILIEVLDDEQRRSVQALLPGYKIAAEMDRRNWLMEPK